MVMELPKELGTLLAEGLSYSKWEEDVAQIKRSVTEGRSVDDSTLANMRRRQRYHEGDRTFNPEIIQLDAVISGGLDYDGWQKDVADAEDNCVNYLGLFDRSFARIVRRQAVFDSGLAGPVAPEVITLGFLLVDELLAEGISYPKWEEDVVSLKRQIVDHDSDPADELAKMRRRQRYHEGDRTFNPEIIQLDAVISGGLDYDGWQKDLADAEDNCVNYVGLFDRSLDRILSRQSVHTRMEENGTLVMHIKLIARKWAAGDDVNRIIRAFLDDKRSPRKQQLKVKPSAGAAEPEEGMHKLKI